MFQLLRALCIYAQMKYLLKAKSCPTFHTWFHELVQQPKHQDDRWQVIYISIVIFDSGRWAMHNWHIYIHINIKIVNSTCKGGRTKLVNVIAFRDCYLVPVLRVCSMMKFEICQIIEKLVLFIQEAISHIPLIVIIKLNYLMYIRYKNYNNCIFLIWYPYYYF